MVTAGEKNSHQAPFLRLHADFYEMLLKFIPNTGLLEQKVPSTATQDMLRHSNIAVCMHILQLKTLLCRHAVNHAADAEASRPAGMDITQDIQDSMVCGVVYLL